MKRDVVNKHGICSSLRIYTKKNIVPVLKHYMQITITMNSISKKIKKGKIVSNKRTINIKIQLVIISTYVWLSNKYKCVRYMCVKISSTAIGTNRGDVL